jgi:TM2 domain-containing membrane protein YozV
MDHATQQHAARRQARQYHPDPVFDQVLAMFFEQGHDQLGPSFLAYELDLTTRAAEQILDEMVKHSLLELDFDDDGNLYYSLNSEVLFEMEQRQAPSPMSGDRHRLNDWPVSTSHVSPQGFDGTTGQGVETIGQFGRDLSRHNQPRHNQPSHTAHTGPDGCDGTIGHPGDASRHAPPNARQGQAYRPQQADAGSPHDRTRTPGPRTDAQPSGGELVHQTESNLPARRRNAEPMVAALLSVLLVGTGQIYNRDVGKGVAFFVVYAVLLTTFFPLGWMVNVWAAIDAYSSAQRRNLQSTENT